MSKHPSSTHRYPRNSPHAAARIVALALNSNGEVKPSEVDDGESVVLLAAIDHWGLHPEEHELLEPPLYGLDFQVTSQKSTGST